MGIFDFLKDKGKEVDVGEEVDVELQNQMQGNIGQQQYDQAQKGYDLNSANHYLRQSLPYQQAQMGVNIGMGPAQAFGENVSTTPNGGTFGAIMAPIMSMGSAAMGAYGGGG